MPLPSLSSKRGVTGCSFSVWLGLSQETVKDRWLSQGQNANCQESPAQGTGKIAWSSPGRTQMFFSLVRQQHWGCTANTSPGFATAPEQNSCELRNTDEVSSELGWTWETPGNLCATWAGSCSRTTSWPSSILASFCANSLKVLRVDRMNCTTNPTWSPTQHVNRIISTMKDQDREKLITETAKMKHKNKLRLVLSLCPQCLFFHPQFCFYFQLLPLLGSSFLSSLLSTNTFHFVLFKSASCDKSCLITLPAHPTKNHFQPKIIDVSKDINFPEVWGQGEIPIAT